MSEPTEPNSGDFFPPDPGFSEAAVENELDRALKHESTHEGIRIDLLTELLAQQRAIQNYESFGAYYDPVTGRYFPALRADTFE